EGQEAIPCPVAIPGRHALQQLPTAVADCRLTQDAEQFIVELPYCLIDGFVWAAAKMRRDAFLPAVGLSLMKEPQARGQEVQTGRRLVDSRREDGCGARLVVVLQKASHLVLIVETREEVFAYRPGMTIAETVIEPFVVRVIEPLLLKRPFQVPVDLG